MIKQIETYKLVEHPQNPRLEMGDLTELKDSIKENGIFQNLTVVSTETFDVYRVIIGHRRLQAAILAGLDTVPCAVVEMDEQTQLSTMLLENMQRSDLTMYEQAQGIQQCLDFGMTINDISKKTGFSRTTVRRRVKMLELDPEKVKTASNATLDDYIKLEEINSIETKNNLLSFIGTNNFNLEVERAIQKEQSFDNSLEKEPTEELIVLKEPEIILLSRNLRINFMKEVFTRKISSLEIATAAGVINKMFIDGIDKKNSFKIFNEIVNPNSIDDSTLINRMFKNRSNFLVVAAFEVLEENSDKTEVYQYLKSLGYEISDDEKEMLSNYEN